MLLKIKLILLVSITAVCLSSCKRDDVLSKRQLEDILFEMHLSDGIVHALNDKTQLQSTDTVIMYKAIFEKYNCSRDKFEKSMRIYAGKQETMTQIYENIKQRFNSALKNFGSTDLKVFVKNIIDKVDTQLKNFSTETGNIKSTDDFVEELMKLLKDIPENSEQDSAIFENTEKNF